MTCIPEKTGFLLWPGMVVYTGQQRMGKKNLLLCVALVPATTWTVRQVRQWVCMLRWLHV